MGRRLLVAASLIALCAAPALAQKAAAYQAPKNGWGQPDLQGNWTTATITPVTRDAKYGDRNVLTKAEADALEQATQAQIKRADEPTPPEATVKDLKNADCGADGISGFNCGYNQGWKDPGTPADHHQRREGAPRSSPRPPTASSRRASPSAAPARGPGGPPARGRMARTDNPEGFSLGERCLLSFGSSAGPPMLPLMYNNNYEIVQGKDTVAINVEMVHDVRHIHLTGGHVPASMKLWMGDSVGHWEGDTLVVETTNMRPEQGLRGGSAGQKVIERFRRISPTQLSYQFTIDDPATYTAPVSGEVQMRTTKGQVYEYACHEGNYALTGMLAGARAEEKQAAAGGAKPGGGGN